MDDNPFSVKSVSDPRTSLGKLNGVDEEVRLVFEVAPLCLY